MGEGEGDDLPGIGRIGQDFLIARNRGVEAHLAARVAFGADTLAPDSGTVGQYQGASRAFRCGSERCLMSRGRGGGHVVRATSVAAERWIE